MVRFIVSSYFRMVSSSTIMLVITVAPLSVKFDKTEADFPFIYLFIGHFGNQMGIINNPHIKQFILH